MHWSTIVFFVMAFFRLRLAASSTAPLEYLDSSTFDKTIADNKHVLVNFCKPSVRACKRFSYEWENASQEDIDVKFATVNCEVSKDLCEKYNVSSFPTVKMLISGAAVDIEAVLKKDVITTIARQLTEPPIVSDLKTSDEVKSFTAKHSVSAVAFVKPDDEDTLDTLTALASTMTWISIAVAPEAVITEVWDGEASSSGPNILLFADFRDNVVVFAEKEFTFDSIKSFLLSESFPLVGMVSNYNRYVARRIPIVWCFLRSDDRLQEHIAILEKAASESKGKLSWLWLDGDAYGQVASAMGLVANKWPAIVIDDQASKKYVYPSDAEFTNESLAKFASQVLAGELSPFVKSEEPPADNAGPLIQVVATTFDDLVMKSNNDVLLMIHAHWCGHCQNTMPKFDATAQVFADVGFITVAAVDASKNDIPLDYKGFPTFYFIPSNNKNNPITYNGDRTVQGFSSFILEHTTKTLSANDHNSIMEKAKHFDEDAKKGGASDSEKDEL